MSQIICYIYEYKGIQKIRNAGFLKIQQRGRTLLVQLHIKGLALTNSEMLCLGIYYKADDLAIWEHISDLPVKNKGINMQLSFPNSFFANQKHLQECDGLLFTGPYEECYVASWSKAPFSTEKLQKYVEVEAKSPTALPAEEEPVKAETVTANSEVRAAQNKYPDCRKISRSEMSILPRRFWNLANNSFLLHGIHNYHHLMLVEMEDHFILGVPGLYDKKEARAADLFGFPIFSIDYLSALALNEDECSDCENFGYWCKTISKLK